MHCWYPLRLLYLHFHPLPSHTLLAHTIYFLLFHLSSFKSMHRYFEVFCSDNHEDVFTQNNKLRGLQAVAHLLQVLLLPQHSPSIHPSVFSPHNFFSPFFVFRFASSSFSPQAEMVDSLHRWEKMTTTKE